MRDSLLAEKKLLGRKPNPELSLPKLSADTRDIESLDGTDEIASRRLDLDHLTRRVAATTAFLRYFEKRS